MRTNSSLIAILTLALTLGVLAGCSRQSAPTDAQIATDVQTKIYGDSAIQSRQITLQVANGVVTLNGNVDKDSERTSASADAATVAGVKTVVNNLQVQQAQVTPPPAAEAAPASPPQRQTASAKPIKKERAQTATKRHHRDHSQDQNSDVQPQTAPADNQVADNMAPPQAPPTPPPPVVPPPPQKVTIPAGTQLSVRLNDPLDSERNQVGDTFHGSLSSPITLNGETVIPAGADVVGRVAEVKSAGRFAGNSVLTLELTSVSVNGRTYNVQTNQWSRSGKGQGKGTATKIGVGTAAGAVLGGLIGGGRGAAIGAASGAGAGTGVAAAKKGQQIKLAPEAVLNFQTINALTVTPQGLNDHNSGRTPLS
jgi:hypothetical protein